MSLARRRATSTFAVIVVLVVMVPVACAAVLTQRFPCWRYSNAAWCGHFCDDDPCACPERARYPNPYGSGPGCVP